VYLNQSRYKDKEKNVTDNLHAVSLHALDDDCSVKHLQRCETCVAIKGDYWHGKKQFHSYFILTGVPSIARDDQWQNPIASFFLLYDEKGD